MSEIKTSYVIGGGYDEFWNCKKRYRVLKGSKASKKSSVTSLNLIYRLMKYPGSNLLVVRAVMNTHRDSTFAQLKWAQERLGVTHLWQNTVSPLEMCYKPTGQKILFRGFDDVLKIASTTVEKGVLNFVWIEEAFEIQNLADFEKLDLSVPRGSVPDGLFKQTTITFNPWSKEHWLKKRFFDFPDADTAVFTTNYLCNEFLDSVDKAVFERMKLLNPRKYATAGLGEWGISEGLVFEDFKVEERDVSGSKWKKCFGLDYGYVNDPTAFIGAAVNLEKMELYIFDEFYEYGMLNSEIAKRISEKGYSKERIRADSAEPKSNEDLRRLGIRRVVPAKKGQGSILNGISKIREFSIIISPDCRDTLREISSYIYSKTLTDRGKPLPEDRNNHLMDALRYALEDVNICEENKNEITKTGEILLRRWQV